MSKKQSLPKIIYSHPYTIFENVLGDTICILIELRRRTIFLGSSFYFKGDVRSFVLVLLCFVLFILISEW